MGDADQPAAHLDALDGLRGFAVVSVVLCHTFACLAGGLYGVDVFFVLSGFLITSLLVAENTSRGRVDYRAFYIRRALRLLPALVTMIVMVSVFTAITGSNELATHLVVAIVVVLLYVANWWQSLHNGLGYLAHCWSLSIEEQFYIVWPALLIGVVLRRRTVPILVGAVVAVWVLRVTFALTVSRDSSGWTFLRADGLILGSLLAIVVRRGRVPAVLRRPGTGWLGATVLLAAMLTYHADQSYRLMMIVGYTVVSVSATLVLACCLTQPTHPITTALRAGWLRVLGRVSYGIYLFHYPIFQFVRGEIGPGGVTRYVVEYAGTAVAVVASWYLVEQPFLRLKDRIGRPRNAMLAAEAT